MKKTIACGQPDYQKKMYENASHWHNVISKYSENDQATLLQLFGTQTRLFLQLSGPHDCFSFFDLSIKKLLQKYLQTQHCSPYHSDGKFRLVSVGAGLALESCALRDFFSTVKGYPVITNIDSDNRYDLSKIEKSLPYFFMGNDLERVYSALKERQGNYRVADGCKSTGYGKEPFDVGFLFHPYAKLSDKIMNEMLAHIKPEGLIVVTTYYDFEALMVKNYLQKIGCNIIDIQHNTDAIIQYFTSLTKASEKFGSHIPKTANAIVVIAKTADEDRVSKQNQSPFNPMVVLLIVCLALFIAVQKNDPTPPA